MKLSGLFRPLFIAVASVSVLASPLVTEDAQVLVIAVAVALTVYDGYRSRTVAPVFALLLFTEVWYGSVIGGSSVPYLLAVVVSLSLHRFIAIPRWSDRDGWRLSDFMTTVLEGYLLCLPIFAIGAGIGSWTPDAGIWLSRIRSLVTARAVLMVLIAVPVTCIVMRRLAIPFRRAILFGT